VLKLGRSPALRVIGLDGESTGRVPSRSLTACT
jgi:hypothetical protein